MCDPQFENISQVHIISQSPTVLCSTAFIHWWKI